MSEKSHKILLVEDEAPVLKALADAFKELGYKVFEAKNGNQGLELARQEDPNIILLDILMPDKDGLEALKELKAEEKFKNTIVFMLTNFDDMEKISEAIKLGASGYLLKAEMDLEDVVKKVEEALNP